MDKLFDLTFFTNDEDYEEGFHIGLFTTQEEAESVAERYSKEVPGFKDYDCISRVFAFPVIGGTDQPSRSTASWDGIPMRIWMKPIFLSAVALQTGMKRKKQCYWQKKEHRVKNGH